MSAHSWAPYREDQHPERERALTYAVIFIDGWLVGYAIPVLLYLVGPIINGLTS